MPYVRQQATVDSQSELIDALATELQSPSPQGQPIILEDATPATKSIRVHVIWDQWESCPPALRFDIIRLAYDQAFGTEKAGEITLAIGVSLSEAINLGLLPYEVRPSRRPTLSPSKEDYVEAMLKAGGHLVPGETFPRLRFATLGLAEDVVDHLQELLSNSRWVIRQDVPPS